MLTLIGTLIISVIVYLLLTEKVSPMIALVLVPLVGAVVAGFSIDDLNKFYASGIKSVVQIAIMFIFAIIFFGIMNDVGLFQPLINLLIKLTKGNVIAVTVGTVLISVLAQLDGAGASTFLLVVPPLLPLYKKLRMNPYLLFLLLASSAGLINMLPWGGPTGRIASVLNLDVAVVYQPLIQVQFVGLFFILIMAVLLGVREKRRIAKEYGNQPYDIRFDPAVNTQQTLEQKSQAPARPKYFWLNVVLLLVTLGVLISAILPSGYVFMIAVALALLINYRSPKEQLARITAHSGGAIQMASIILGAGTFLGILKESGMLSAIATDLVTILPDVMVQYLHIIIGVLGVPLELVFSTDAYYFGLFPIVEHITSQAGVPSLSAGYAMLIGSIVGTFISPFSPALWMGLGLAKLSMGQHIRYSFFWIWGISVLTLVASIAIGVI